MKQAIIYARFSPRPNPDLSSSIEFQFEKCRAYCDAHDWDVLATYRDAGLSGKQAYNRPGLQEAILHVCKIQGVFVVYALSRLIRSTKDAIDIAGTLEKAKADLVCVTTNIDTTTPWGRCVYTILAAVDQANREAIAEWTRAAMLSRQANGKRVSDKPPYGWRIDPNDDTHLIRDEREQRHITTIMSWRRQGMGYRTICRELTRACIKPRATNWYHSTIKNIEDRENRGIINGGGILK